MMARYNSCHETHVYYDCFDDTILICTLEREYKEDRVAIQSSRISAGLQAGNAGVLSG